MGGEQAANVLAQIKREAIEKKGGKVGRLKKHQLFNLYLYNHLILLSYIEFTIKFS